MPSTQNSSAFTQISSEEVSVRLKDQTTCIIDVRPVEAYNGWKLQGESRGGHIPGAKSLPARWSEYIDWIEIVRAKGIRPDDALIVYGYGQEESEKVALQFHRSGYQQVELYNDFVSHWSINEAFPVEHLSRYRHLVSADWLKSLLYTGSAPEYDNNHFVLCHAYYQDRTKYEEGHIPGAVAIDNVALENPETWNRRTPQELRETLQTYGISSNSTVILYGKFSFPDNRDPFPGSSAGHLGAIRCAVIMLYAGVKDVRILNGGMTSWVEAGFEVSTEEVKPTPIEDFGATIPGRPELMVDLDEAKEILASPDKNLVCVRSWRELIGEVSGYNYIEKKGRIPGAVFGNCGSDAYHMENYRNLDHTTRDYHEIEALWSEIGITPDKHNAFYCGTGWRGSEAFINAWLMGWPRVSLFDGGWFEWSSDDNNPYEVGPPTE